MNLVSTEKHITNAPVFFLFALFTGHDNVIKKGIQKEKVTSTATTTTTKTCTEIFFDVVVYGNNYVFYSYIYFYIKAYILSTALMVTLEYIFMEIKIFLFYGVTHKTKECHLH